MNTKKTLLLLLGFFAIAVVIYVLVVTFPDILEYFSKAHFEIGGERGESRYREDREMFWKALMGLILQICFYCSIAFWSLYEAKKLTEPMSTLYTLSLCLLVYVFTFLCVHIMSQTEMYLSVVFSTLLAAVFGTILAIIRKRK